MAMQPGFDFSAIKYSGSDVPTILELDQPTSGGDFDASALEKFNPIRCGDALRVELRDGLDPYEVLKILRFDSDDDFDGTDYQSWDTPMEWVDDFEESYAYNGTIRRYAVLVQGVKTWRIVGFEHKGDIKLILMDPDYMYEAGSRYAGIRPIGDFTFHTEGPGPVSWDFENAIFDAGDFWLQAFGGDSGQHDKALDKPSNPEEFAQTYLDWLTSSRALTLFILNYAPCNWSRKRDKEELDSALGNTYEIMSFYGHLNQHEKDLILKAIQESEYHDKELIAILGATKSDLASVLVAEIEEVFDYESAQALVWDDDLVNRIKRIAGLD